MPDAEALFALTVSATLMAGARGYLFDGPRTRPHIAGMARDHLSECYLLGGSRTDVTHGDGDPYQRASCFAGRVSLFTVLAVNGAPCTLTSREVEILQHVAAGETSKVIGHRMRLSPGSVKSYLHRIGRRLGTTDRAFMVLLAMRAGAVI